MGIVIAMRTPEIVAWIPDSKKAIQTRTLTMKYTSVLVTPETLRTTSNSSKANPTPRFAQLMYSV